MANSNENTIILTSNQPDPQFAAASIKHSARFDGIAIGLGAIGLIVLVAFILQGTWPFIVAAGLFLLLFPFREYRAARTIMFTAGILFGFCLCITLSGILFPFIVGLLIPYLFNPAFPWTERHGQFHAN